MWARRHPAQTHQPLRCSLRFCFPNATRNRFARRASSHRMCGYRGPPGKTCQSSGKRCQNVTLKCSHNQANTNRSAMCWTLGPQGCRMPPRCRNTSKRPKETSATLSSVIMTKHDWASALEYLRTALHPAPLSPQLPSEASTMQRNRT